MELRHIVIPVGVVLAAGLIAAPAASAAHSSSTPKARPTSITLKATHERAPKHSSHKVALTATLKAGHQRLAGETLYLEKRDAGTHKFSDPVAIAPTDSNGQASVPVTPNAHGKGKKEQYRVVFQGDTGSPAYKASRSGVITVAGS